MASINEFKSTMARHGFNPGNRYKVAISHGNGMIQRLLSDYCENVSLPGRSLATSDIKIGSGLTKKMPYNSIYEDVTMTFRLDSDMLIKKFFDIWHNQIHNSSTGNMGYLDSYRSQVGISVYDREGSMVNGIILTNAYPIAVAQIDLSHSAQNEIAKLSVTFAYEKFAPAGAGGDVYE